MGKGTSGVRYAEVYRETRETRIQVVLDLDGGTRRDIQTGVGFFDHMLAQLAFHGGMDLGVTCEGDLHIDDHHTLEDVGIVLGQAIVQALDNDDPIERYGSCHLVMDEALVLAALDVSGRGMLTYQVPFQRERLGDMATENVREFFRALASHGGLSLQLHKIAGENDHHVCEATFKAFGRALCAATRKSERRGGHSTKGKRD